MRHLVTGGAGFVGSHLCDRLIADGHEVIALDNLFTSRVTNIEHLLRNPRFEFVRADVCDPFYFEVDRIWSLACPASPIHYQKNAARTIETGVIGTLNAVKLAHRVGARVLLTSTSEIYGEPLEHPQREDYRGNVNHNGPRACYDTAKCCGEAIMSTWAAQYGVDTRIARLFNAYGPRMAESDGRVVSTLIVQALRGEPLTIFGDGSQTRSFQYVNDLIEGLVRLMDYCGETPHLPVNLGNPAEFTIAELADKVAVEVGKRTNLFPDIIRKPLPKDDPTRRKPDISRAKELLNWEPKIGLDEGLSRTVDYFQKLISAEFKTALVST